MLKRIRYIFLFLILGTPSFAQLMDDPFDYGQEFLWAVTKTTRSGVIAGGMFRYSAKIKDNTFRTLGLEVANIKHPQEFKFRYPGVVTPFVFGKQNYFFAVRPQYGYEKILFKKADQKGVQINGGIAAGPSFGLLVPYYVNLGEGGSAPYDPNTMSPYQVVGATGVLRGLGESNLRIGVHARASLLFEFGAFKSNITGFEIGVLIEQYAGEVIILPLSENQNFLPSAFISILFGRRR